MGNTELNQQYLAYAWPEMLSSPPGLGHMKEIVRTLLKESERTSRIAILPPLLSNRLHNPRASRRLNWSDYYDFSNFPVLDEAWHSRRSIRRTLRTISKATFVDGKQPFSEVQQHYPCIVRCFDNPDIFGDGLDERNFRVSEHLTEPAFSAHFPQSILEHRQAVVTEIGQPRGVLHIRRGDSISPITSVDAITAYLADRGVRTNDRVFIMSNERSPDYAKRIQSIYPNVVFEHEVNVLQELMRSRNDNYLVFRVCQALQSKYDSLNLGSRRSLAGIQSARPVPTRPSIRERWRIRRYRLGREWWERQTSATRGTISRSRLFGPRGSG